VKDGQLTADIEMDVENQTANPQSGEVRLTFRDHTLGTQPFQLKAAEEMTLHFPLAMPIPDTSIEEPLHGEVTTKSGARFTADYPFRFAVAQYVSKPPVLDGLLNDWVQATPLHLHTALQEAPITRALWNGPQDCSGKLYLSWNSEYLYWAMRVWDHSRLLMPDPDHFYEGTCIELFLNADWQQGDKKTANYFQFGFIPQTDPTKPHAVVWQGKTTIDPHDSVVRLMPDGYVITGRIPFNIFTNFTPADGAILGLEAIVDDAKAPSLFMKGQISWVCNSHAFAHPIMYGRLLLRGGK